MTPLESWILVVLALFILGLAAPVVGALRAWLRGLETLRRIDREQSRSVELEEEWAARRAALAPPTADVTRRPGESDEDLEARMRETLEVAQQHLEVAEGRVAAFAAEGMIAPTRGNLGELPGMEARRVLRTVLNGNSWNLALVLAGPVLATTASIIALFPAWDLP